jgi:hypothetical protein
MRAPRGSGYRPRMKQLLDPGPTVMRRLGFVIVAVVAAVTIGAAAATWNLVDFHVYWEAAERLRAGEPLYPAGAETDDLTYRYASWFAYAFVPLTFLPVAWVAAAWTVLCAASLAAIVWPYLRTRRAEPVAFGLLCLVMLVWEAGSGNVGTPLVALVMYTARRSAGPVAIGVFASLKGFPILYALAYVAQRQYWRAGVAVAVTVALAAPTLLEDLSAYPFGAGSTNSLFGISPLLWAAVLAAAVVAALRTRRAAWSLAALAVLLSWTKLWPAAAYGGALAIGPYNDGALDERPRAVSS